MSKKSRTDALAAQEMLELARESFADLAASVQANALLARDDMGWAHLGGEKGFTTQQRKQAAEWAEIMSIANPLIKRGLALRAAYVWAPGSTGAGVKVQVRDDGDTGQDVDAVVQAFLAANEATFSGSQAREDMERNGLGCWGEVFLALATDQRDGTVQVRRIQPDEITEIVENPDDYADPWLYKREWTAKDVDANGLPTGQPKTHVAWYPALGWVPAVRPKSVAGHPVRWDAPIVHAAVNQPTRSRRGLGDAFASLPWAKLSKEFLEQTALLLKALARFAYRVTTPGDRTQQAARKIAAAGDGSTMVQTTGDTLEAVSKSSATIDPKLVHTYEVWVAAGMGLPVTTLLGDPGSTGARAVAETLNEPTRNEFSLRRQLWDVVIRQVCGHVIDQAVIAPLGPLRGTVTRTGDRQTVTLPDGDGRLVDIDWPDWDTVPLDVLVTAISKADSIDKLPPLWLVRQILTAFGEAHPDDVIAQITDDAGNFLPPEDLISQTRQRQTDRGQ